MLVLRRRAGARAPGARRRRGWPSWRFLVLVGFLVVNKVYSPQYVLWLLPLAVLARPRWRDLLIWQAGELLYFAMVWLYLGGYTASALPAAPDVAYSLAILVRVAAELYLAAVVVRDVLRPARPCGSPRRRTAGSTTTRWRRHLSADRPSNTVRSKAVAVNRTRTSTSVADRGHRGAVGEEQHRGLHVRRLGEEPLLAARR